MLGQSRRPLWKGVLAGTGVGTALGVLGFYLANQPATKGMGFALFFVVPAASGYAIGMVTGGTKPALKAAVPALLISLFLLIAGGKEGPICAVLVMPLILVPLLIGSVLGALVNRKYAQRNEGRTTAGLILLPFLISGTHWTERSLLDQVRVQTVTTSVHVAADPRSVWPLIQSIDHIQSKKPWMMHVGLPVPVRCKLESEGVGAKRVCYFEDGTIEERVSEWSPPNRIRLQIVHTHMGIHHWMGFQEAVYELQPDGDGTMLTRSTTLESALYPAWYWAPWERLGVEQEHRYILQDVAIRASQR